MKGGCLAALLLLSAVFCEEHTHHGPRSPHQSADGEHDATFDHQAVLGSEAKEKEFAGLTTKEATVILEELVKKNDLDNNGQITKKEMYTWITDSFRNLDQEEAMEKFEEEDEDGDGFVTLREYMSKAFGYEPEDVEDMRQSLAKAPAKNEETNEIESSLKVLDEDLRFFRGADLDKDDKLSREEYEAFYSPLNYEHMHKYELERYISQNDADGDGKISLTEFTPEGTSDENQIASKENFNDLDVNKDGLLSEEELKTWVAPGSDELAEEEVSHLIEEADTDKDGQLSTQEILDKAEMFVGSSATDYGNLLQHEHEEL